MTKHKALQILVDNLKEKNSNLVSQNTELKTHNDGLKEENSNLLEKHNELKYPALAYSLKQYQEFIDKNIIAKKIHYHFESESQFIPQISDLIDQIIFFADYNHPFIKEGVVKDFLISIILLYAVTTKILVAKENYVASYFFKWYYQRLLNNHSQNFPVNDQEQRDIISTNMSSFINKINQKIPPLLGLRNTEALHTRSEVLYSTFL